MVVFAQRIPTAVSASLRCLAWASAPGHAEQLFAGGLNGKVVELDPGSLSIKVRRPRARAPANAHHGHPRRAQNVVDSYGGAVWSLATSPAGDHVAVGCEDGIVRLFRTSDTHGLEYERSFMAVEGVSPSVLWAGSA